METWQATSDANSRIWKLRSNHVSAPTLGKYFELPQDGYIDFRRFNVSFSQKVTSIILPRIRRSIQRHLDFRKSNGTARSWPGQKIPTTLTSVTCASSEPCEPGQVRNLVPPTAASLIELSLRCVWDRSNAHAHDTTLPRIVGRWTQRTALRGRRLLCIFRLRLERKACGGPNRINFDA